MRRIVIAVMGTISTLVMLFAFDASHRTGGGATTALGGAGGGAANGGGVTATTDNNGTLGSGDAGAGSTAGDTPQAGASTAAPTAGATTAASATKKATPTSKTYTGDSVMTQWGPVQVQIIVKNGKVVRSRAVVFPNENDHDIGINNYALPILDQATVQLQNAQFDNVSGATVTTDGYRQSLQSALDKAHL